MWLARSAEFMHTGLMDTLRWLRVVGDTVFALGVLSLGWFIVGLKTGCSLTGRPDAVVREFPEGLVGLRLGLARPHQI
jgi:nitric oxide reductase subunit B